VFWPGARLERDGLPPRGREPDAVTAPMLGLGWGLDHGGGRDVGVGAGVDERVLPSAGG
jgi:hypothetical protein